MRLIFVVVAVGLGVLVVLLKLLNLMPIALQLGGQPLHRLGIKAMPQVLVTQMQMVEEVFGWIVGGVNPMAVQVIAVPIPVLMHQDKAELIILVMVKRLLITVLIQVIVIVVMPE